MSTERDPLAPIEALLDANEARLHRSGAASYTGIGNTALSAALAEARLAVDALVADNRALVRDRGHEMRAKEVERQRANSNYDRLVEVSGERDAARGALARVEALASVCECLTNIPATQQQRYCGCDIRAALAQPATDEEAGQ